MSQSRNAAIARALLEALPEGHRGSATRVFVGREINDLPHILEDGELPVRAATGRRGGSSVLVVATNRRVLVIDRERSRSLLIAMEYSLIHEVRRRATGFSITTDDGRDVSVDEVPKAMCDHFAGWLRLNLKAAEMFGHAVNVETSHGPAATARPVRQLPGGFRVNVIGESLHADEIRRVVGAAASSFGSTLLWASLVPDVDNPYERAVKVLIDGHEVGQLDDEAARAFRSVAERITELGCDARCAATVIGGGEGGYFGVVLDLGTPEACMKELC